MLWSKAREALWFKGFLPLIWAGLLIFGTQNAPAVQRQYLRGHVPTAARGLVAVGSLPGSRRLNLSIGLPLRNEDALTNLLEQLYDPSSPMYHHYLSRQEFTARFGPAEQDYQGLIDFMQSRGLTVSGRHPNRLVLDVSGAVSDIESAFATRLRVYSHPKEDRKFFAPEIEPSVEPGVSILDISGLDNYLEPHPASLHPLPAWRVIVPNVGSAPGGSYRGNDFRAAYLPGVGLSGAGQVVGLLEFDGYYTNDIATYEADAGLPSVTLQNILLDGFSGTAGVNNAEVALDIEVAISLAPGLSSVRVYEGIRPNSILSQMANDNLAKQLSSSWTYGVNRTSENVFRQFAAQGQSMFQASGDKGAYPGAVPPPADDPNVTIVGGTTLTTSGPGGTWVSETTWNWASTGQGTSGSGGGVSTAYTIPSYQMGLSMTANQGSTTMRNLPDVAMTADNIWVVWNNGSTGPFGGTSASTPLWAAFMALVNQQAVASGKATIGFVNPALYSIGTGTSYSSSFHDITTGSNTNADSPTNFVAVAGYDLCTGWGTPAGQGLINALTGVTNLSPFFNRNPFTEPAVNVGQAYSGSISNQVTDPNPADPLTFVRLNGPAWLGLGADGSLSGTPANSDVGTNIFTVSVTSSGGLSNSATMFINVNGAPAFTSNPFTQPDANVGQPYLRSISASATDPNPGNTFTFAKLTGPAWLSVGPGGAISGTPANTDVGTNSFTVSVTDSGGLSDTATMLIHVNGAPAFTLNPFAEPTVNVGQAYSGSIASQASDPNPGNTVTFAKAGGPGWLSVAGNGSLSGTPANADVGTNSFVVTATDSGGLSASATMLINVNGPPSFTSNPLVEPTVNVGQAYSGSIAGQASDPNPGDTLTFAKATGPAWLVLSANGSLSGIPANSDVGTNTFTITVTDSGGLSGSAVMFINVNGAPGFLVNPFILTTAAVGRMYFASITNQASDPNPGDRLSFAKLSGPAWLSLATNGAVSGIAANADVGTNTFTVSVTDSGGLSNSATMLISVAVAPAFVSNPFAEPGVNVGQAYAGSLTNQVVDPNPGDTLSFAKLSGPAWLSLAANGSISGTPAKTDVGTNAFSLSVTDSVGLTNTATMYIKVNGAPAFKADPFFAPPVTVGQAYLASLTNQATDPNTGATLTFAKLSGPAWLIVEPNGSLTGTPTAADAGTNTFVISVSDSTGLGSSATMNVPVTPAAQSPINLQISLQTNAVALSWTGGNPPFQLQVSTNLINGAWQNFGGLLTNHNFTLTPSASAAAYRIQATAP